MARVNLSSTWRFRACVLASMAFLSAAESGVARNARGAELNAAAGSAESGTPRDVLNSEQWQTLDAAVDRGLEFIAKSQRSDGSFNGPPQGQPGITSLGVLAFLSRGHIPSEGVYGARIDRAIDYVLKTQQPDGYLFNPAIAHREQGTYNHAIAGLMLGEVYGMTRSVQRDRVRNAIRLALAFTRQQQLRPKIPGDEGGWRYVKPADGNDADLSVTSWHVMFLRSARNAEFDVPKEQIDEALGYVRRTFSPEKGGFMYKTPATTGRLSRATAGSGILLLSLGGEHETDIARTAGKWILKNPFDKYNQPVYPSCDRYHYSAYYCSQAMFQLGGDYWKQFYPAFQRTLLKHQHSDGSWDPEYGGDANFGNVYTTALTVLALTPPYQLLPIYQR